MYLQNNLGTFGEMSIQKIFIANFRESIVQQKFKGSKVDQLIGLPTSCGYYENDKNFCPPSCEDKNLVSDWLDLSCGYDLMYVIHACKNIG
jgi:hypothetical protein